MERKVSVEVGEKGIKGLGAGTCVCVRARVVDGEK